LEVASLLKRVQVFGAEHGTLGKEKTPTLIAIAVDLVGWHFGQGLDHLF
jgi:hypothetical protein